MLIYKILLPSEWADLESAGTFDGSPDDHDSGFIHFSSREQVAATAMRFFGEVGPLVILVVDADRVGEAVRWEPASNGEHFPHLYAPLRSEDVVAVYHVAGASLVETAVPED